MESNKMLSENLKNTFSALEKAIQCFDESSFNSKPKGNSWSPAMITQHLILAGTDIDKVLLGTTKASQGEADGKVETIKNIFLNFDEKYNSPPFIEPADQNYSQQLQLQKLRAIGNSVAILLADLDLSLTCSDFEFPGMGYLTRFELISFVIFHTQRHTYQLKNMNDLV